MPLPSRIKVTDLITGATLGEDGNYHINEGGYIGFSWDIGGLNPLFEYNGKVLSRDEFTISLSIRSRQGDGESLRSDFGLEDVLFQSYSSNTTPFSEWTWFSKVGKFGETQQWILDRKIYAISDFKTEGSELFDITINYELFSENLSGKTIFSYENTLSVEVSDTSRMQLAIGGSDDDRLNFSDYKYGIYRDQNGHLTYLANNYKSTSTPLVTDFPVYAMGGLGADLYVYNSSNDVYFGPKIISLGENSRLRSPDLKGSSLTNDQFYSSRGDDVWSDGFAAVYAYCHTVMVGESYSYITNLSFQIRGKQRFFDVVQSDSTSDRVRPLNVYLSNNATGDAFFLHDTFSPYNKYVSLGSDAIGRQYAPRLSGIDWLFTGDGNDVVDLTTTELSPQLVCNRVDLGSGDDILMGEFNEAYGGDGDDLIIASRRYSAVSGGPGRDIFAFMSPLGRSGDGVSLSIRDFVTGVDSIKLYVDSNNIEKAQKGGGHNLLATESIQKLANGDLSWTYYKLTDTWGGVTTLYEFKETIKMGGATWSPGDIQLLPFVSIPL